MHRLNRVFWSKAEVEYPEFFHGVSRVLEVGSCNVNGSVRDHFKDVGTYIGVDWRKGENVDVVCMASEMSFDERFDTVISASMLEHDPEWRMSITNIVSQMKPKGILLLSWGASLNGPHAYDTACDGHFHPRPAGQVISLLEHLGVYVHFFSYERLLMDDSEVEGLKRESTKGMGEVCLIAFKDPSLAKGERELSKLLSLDNCNWRDEPVLKQAGPRPPGERQQRKLRGRRR